MARLFVVQSPFLVWRGSALRCATLLVAFLASSQPAFALTTQDSKVAALIQRGREVGQTWLDSKDEKAKKSARKDLDDAESVLKAALERQANCESCYEQLTTVFFLQAYFGFAKNYETTIKTADRGLQRFPSNGRLAYTKGAAYYNAQQYAEASKALIRYLASNPEDDEARNILKESQQHFLGNWYKQSDFYNSRDARVEWFGPQSRVETVFQVTRDWEMGVGTQAATEMSKGATTLKDPDVQAYLEILVRRLTSGTPAPEYDYKVTIVKSPAVNAVTVPGHIFIHTGLLSFVDTESELAGVLAHELGHNFGHHAGRRFIKGQQAQLMAVAVTNALDPKGQVARVAAQLTAKVGIGLFLLAYGRQEEKEADLYGAHLAFNAGYNPTSLAGFFLKMYKANPKQPIGFLSTHPADPDRATYLTDYLESFPLDREMNVDSKAFRDIKAKLPALGADGARKVMIPPQ